MSISEQTHEFIMCAMHQRVRARQRRTIFSCKKTNWRQFFMCLSCYWRWILSLSIKVVCGSTWISPPGSTEPYFDNVMTKFTINYRTDTWKTDFNYLNGTLKRNISNTKDRVWSHFQTPRVENMMCSRVFLNF